MVHGRPEKERSITPESSSVRRRPQRRYKHRRKPKRFCYDPQLLPLALPFRVTESHTMYRIEGLAGVWILVNAMKYLPQGAWHPVARVMTRKGEWMAGKFRQHHSMEQFVTEAMGWKVLDVDKLILCGECGEPAQWAVQWNGELVCDKCLALTAPVETSAAP